MSGVSFRVVKGRMALIATVLGVSGCNVPDPDMIPAVPAAGTVAYQGKPVEAGEIRFIPDRGRPAFGTIRHGRFILSTYKEEDGAIPGRHQVGVIATKEDLTKDGDTIITYIVPEQYASYETSGIRVVIPKQGNIDIAVQIP